MKRCPNCAQETLRTSDWVCQWCGYPLLSGSYKNIAKTYRELKEERMPQHHRVEEELEATFQPEIELNTEVEVGLESEIESQIESDPESEIGLQIESDPESELSLPSEEIEPEMEQVNEPKKKTIRKPATKKKSTSNSKDKAEKEVTPKSKAITEANPKKTTTKRKATAKSKPVSKAEVESSPVQVTETEIELSSPSLEITVDELLSAYENDMEEADVKYSNQLIRITGVIDRVEVKDTFNIYFINLVSSDTNRLLQGVRCVFDSDSGSELSRLVIGQTVTVQGTFDGSMIDISLKDCRLIN